MSLYYKSTRGMEKHFTASEAILKGLADDGGLFVPSEIPKIDMELSELLGLSYKEMAKEILKLYLTDFTKEELSYCVESAYDKKFDTEVIAPVKIAGEYNFLELFHGKTLAFKDMALSILPYFMKVSAKKQGLSKKIVILTATSGDTGKAALEGFAGVEGIDIIVFYPQDGVSEVQKLQMTTQEGENVLVVGVRGNFDDTQTGVKEIFSNADMRKLLNDKDCVFSSANSINIGRLVPQIVYYFSAYSQMVKSGKIKIGEELDFTVPTGNFGNILAGYYAKKMGLPVGNLICASNENKILTDFIKTGVYDRNREFHLTKSPSMDILISSNLERFIHDISGDSEKVRVSMEKLGKEGKYEFEKVDIFGDFASEKECLEAIRNVYDMGYTMDTHTAVAVAVYDKVKKEKGLTNKNVIVSTASPYKFADAVLEGINGGVPKDLEVSDLLNGLAVVSKTAVPEQIKDLDKKEVRHKMVCDKENMVNIVRGFLIV